MLRAILAVLLVAATSAPAVAADEGEWDPNKGVGFHQNLRVSIGYMRGETPESGDLDPVTGMPVEPEGTTDALMFQFDGVFLGLASVYGNWHGIETSINAMANPWDFNWSVGFPFTMLTVGDGGMLTTRIGGAFGMGVGLRHAYAYVKGRVAGVVIPGRVDGEASVTWIPASASASWSVEGDLEDLTVRGSLFFHPDAYAGRGYEVYLQYYERDRRNSRTTDDPMQREANNHEIKGFGVGAGLTW